MKVNNHLKAFCLANLCFLASNTVKSQCSDNSAPITIRYDTTVYGGGNDFYNLQFPQFDPNLGTLVSVDLKTLVTLRYSFQLENHNANASKHTVRVTRIDNLAFPGSEVEKIDSKNLGPYLLQGSDGVANSGPDYIQDGPLYAFRNFPNVYHLTSGLAGFLGNGTANIDYTTNSLANSVSNINSTLRGNATDTIKFSVIYSYCQTAFLPAEIMQFSANRISTDNVDLRWLAPNDQEGTRYEIEKSADGKVFQKFESVVSKSNVSSNYQAKYVINSDDNKKLFFRIKETGTDAVVKYSQVKTVSIPNNKAGDMKIYPTVSNGSFSISFQEGAKEDYIVSVYGMAGNLVQSEKYLRTNFVHYTSKTPLKAGMYFVVAENIKTKETQKSKIIIQ